MDALNVQGKLTDEVYDVLREALYRCFPEIKCVKYSQTTDDPPSGTMVITVNNKEYRLGVFERTEKISDTCEYLYWDIDMTTLPIEIRHYYEQIRELASEYSPSWK
jgi:hypothetical protein